MTVHPADDRAVADLVPSRPEAVAAEPTVFGPRGVDPAGLPSVSRDGLTVTTSAAGPSVTVVVAGELLQETAAVLTTVLGALADDHAVTEVVVDLRPTTFMDSTGLGTLVTLHNEVVHRGGSLRLTRPDPRVFRLFELTRLDSFFDFGD